MGATTKGERCRTLSRLLLKKGGVGKTTTTVNMAAGLAELGKKVFVIDADAQANTSKILLQQMELRETRNVPEVLSDPNGGLFSAAACPTNYPNIMIVPNHIKCLLWEEQVRGSVDGILGFKRIFHKDKALQEYDYIVLDTPPNLGVMINNALMISNYVIIPVPFQINLHWMVLLPLSLTSVRSGIRTPNLNYWEYCLPNTMQELQPTKTTAS